MVKTFGFDCVCPLSFSDIQLDILICPVTLTAQVDGSSFLVAPLTEAVDGKLTCNEKYLGNVLH